MGDYTTFLSLEWDSNPRPFPYQGNAPPLSYPGLVLPEGIELSSLVPKTSALSVELRELGGGEGIRTPVAQRLTLSKRVELTAIRLLLCAPGGNRTPVTGSANQHSVR